MERISMSDINMELVEAIESGVSHEGLENILISYGFPVEVIDSIIEDTVRMVEDSADRDAWLETNVQEEIYSPYYGA